MAPPHGLLIIEPVIDLVVASLRARLPDKMAALAPEWPQLSPIDMPVPQPEAITFAERINPVSFPAIEVVPVRSHPVDDNRGYILWGHVVAIGVFVENAHEEDLARLILRYMRCVVECLNDSRAVNAQDYSTIVGLDGPAFTGGGLEALDWSPVRSGDRNLFERDAWLSILFSKQDTA